MTTNGPELGFGTSALYLAWQDAASRRWFPVGKLTRELVGFSFAYLSGFSLAAEVGLSPLPAFPDPRRIYRAEHLFPFFRNRVMNRTREDYEAWVDRMGYAEADALTPDELAFEVLARSRGRRSTDPFELFPFPLVKRDEQIWFRVDCFAHGVRHTEPSAQARSLQLASGESLRLAAEPDNPADADAVGVFATPGIRVGYVPRYYGRDLKRLLAAGVPANAWVERVNPPPTPTQQRLLMAIEAPWLLSEGPLNAPIYEPLSS